MLQKPRPTERLLRSRIEVGGEPSDHRANNRGAWAPCLNVGDRLDGSADTAVAGVVKRRLKWKRETIRPEHCGEFPQRASDLRLIPNVERESDEAQARVADADVVDIKLSSRARSDISGSGDTTCMPAPTRRALVPTM
jgi:hypothetical protein